MLRSSSLSTAYQRCLISLVVFVLLWGTSVYAVHDHDHHDQGTESEAECQICQYGSGNALFLHVDAATLTLPQAAFDKPSIVQTGRAQIRLLDPRAPPIFS